jgi:hypothetical protein
MRTGSTCSELLQGRTKSKVAGPFVHGRHVQDSARKRSEDGAGASLADAANSPRGITVITSSMQRGTSDTSSSLRFMLAF